MLPPLWHPATDAAEGHAQQLAEAHHDDEELREVFHQFVGETFYRQLLSSMRKTTSKPAYLHGGRAEEAFQSQLDTVLAEKMTQAGDGSLSDAMYELFQLNRT